MNPSIARQLIYNGIFVLVSRGTRSDLYDFPHRRFREVLAARDLCRPGEYVEFLEHAHHGHVSELLRVLRGLKQFNDPNFQYEVLRLIFQLARSNKAPAYAAQLSARFIELKPERVTITEHVRDFIRQELGQEAPAFALSGRMLECLRGDAQVRELARDGARKGLKEGNAQRLSLGLSVLVRCAPEEARDFLENIPDRGSFSDEIFAVLLREAMLLGLADALTFAHNIGEDRRLQDRFFVIVIKFWDRISRTTEELDRVVGLLTHDSLYRLFLCGAIEDPLRASEIGAKFLGESVDPHLGAHLFGLKEKELRRLAKDLEADQAFFFVGEKARTAADGLLAVQDRPRVVVRANPEYGLRQKAPKHVHADLGPVLKEFLRRYKSMLSRLGKGVVPWDRFREDLQQIWDEVADKVEYSENPAIVARVPRKAVAGEWECRDFYIRYLQSEGLILRGTGLRLIDAVLRGPFETVLPLEFFD